MAGHQRTKTMKLLGYTHVPAFVLDGVNSTDEVRFNQLHNYAECEVSEVQPDIRVSVPEGTEGFFMVPNKDIAVITKGGNNSRVVDLTKMILRYGQFANAVCNHEGKVIISTVYAKAVKLMGMDLLVYVLPGGKEELALSYFSKEYGVFEYSHLERKTYIQSFAQKHVSGRKTVFRAAGAIPRCTSVWCFRSSRRTCMCLTSEPDRRTMLPG